MVKSISPNRRAKAASSASRKNAASSRARASASPAAPERSSREPQIGDKLPVELTRIFSIVDCVLDHAQCLAGVAASKAATRASTRSFLLNPSAVRTASALISPGSSFCATAAEQCQMLEQTKRVTQAAGGMPGDDSAKRRPECDALAIGDSLQATHEIRDRDAPKVEPLAAGDDRRKEFLRVGGGEDEAGMGGRLFQRLEEGVRRRAGDLVRFVDDVDLGAKLRGRVADALPQIADVVDAAVAGGVDLDDVGRRAGIDGQQFAQALQGRGSGRPGDN